MKIMIQAAALAIVVASAAMFLGLASYMAMEQAFGREADYSGQPAAVREWFRTLMRPDYPAASCCGEADAYEADIFEQRSDQYVAIITGTRGATAPMIDGRLAYGIGDRIAVPNSKIKWDRGNPTGHGIIFLGTGGQVYCYVTPAAL